jgi:uncharacterized protein DUF6916
MQDSPLPQHATFVAQLNTSFKVNGGAELIELKLVEVSEFRETPRQERFSVLFRGPRARPLSQGLYDFEHEEIGSFNLFIVPVAQDEQEISYEAVFNRVRGGQTAN